MNAQMPQKIVHDAPVAIGQQKVKMVTLLTLATVAVILIAYHETTWSMVSIWNRSETFAHGFLIFPFSAYLIWVRRKHLGKLSSQPNFLEIGRASCRERVEFSVVGVSCKRKEKL